MGISFVQANCVEGKRIDPRQAAVIKKYKPDIIFFEMPSFRGNPSSPFNTCSAKKKPFQKVERIKKWLRKIAKKTPYALSDALIWDNIASLWRKGHNVLLFNIDAPQELRYESFVRYRHVPLVRQKRQWQFWVYLYIRETIMTRFTKQILKKYSRRKKLIVAVFLQSIHWEHVQFLLKSPTKEKIWRYYFGKFPKLTPDIINKELKQKNPILYSYWDKYGRGA